jgi:hypothetical protein
MGWRRVLSERLVYFRAVMSLRTLALVSGVYDLLLALPMLMAASAMARLFGAPPPTPVLNAQLNGLFTLTLALGYFWAAGDVERRRGYLWIAGVVAKGLGAALFLLDHLVQGSPRAFLLFALTDGTLAVLTLALLLRSGTPTLSAGAGFTSAPERPGGEPEGRGRVPPRN